MARSMSDIDEVVVAHIDIGIEINAHVELLCRMGEVRIHI